MINQPSAATSCSFVKLDGIIKDIELYALSHDNSQLHAMSNALGNPLYMLTAGTGCRAKPFGVPVKIKFGDKDAYVVDARQVTAISALGQFRVTNLPDYELLGLIGLTTTIWDSSDRNLVGNVASDLSPIYATWLSSTISAAFNLAVDQRTEISILAAYFYWTQLGLESDPDRIAARIAKDLKLDFDRVITVVDNAGALTNLESFITAIKTTSGGIRLDKFDVPTLYQVSAGVWMGAMGRPIMEVALEFPPYIVALTNMALVDRSYRRSRFFEYVNLFDRRPEIKQLPESLQHLKKQW